MTSTRTSSKLPSTLVAVILAVAVPRQTIIMPPSSSMQHASRQISRLALRDAFRQARTTRSSILFPHGQPLSSKCHQLRSFSSSRVRASPDGSSREQTKQRTGVRIFIRGKSSSFLTIKTSLSHSDQLPSLSVPVPSWSSTSSTRKHDSSGNASWR
jgi:hypothetical protein